MLLEFFSLVADHLERMNVFFVACCDVFVLLSYLAHEVEEDEETLRQELLSWVAGSRSSLAEVYAIKKTIIGASKELFWAMECRAIVARNACAMV